jgi:hypothetical protein
MRKLDTESQSIYHRYMDNHAAIKEKYEKVMGKPMPSVQLRQHTQSHASEDRPHYNNPESIEHPLQRTQTSLVKPTAPSFFNAKTGTRPHRESSSGPLVGLLFVGFVIFFIMYTLFWLKYFHVTLPFAIPFING